MNPRQLPLIYSGPAMYIVYYGPGMLMQGAPVTVQLSRVLQGKSRGGG